MSLRKHKMHETARRAMHITVPAPGPKNVSDGYTLQRLFAPPATLGKPRRETLANDAALDPCLVQNFLAGVNIEGANSFIGYAACSNLAQNGLMIAGVETLADEMCRKFIELNSTGEEDTAEAITALNAEIKRLDVRGVFRDAAANCGYFGGCLVYMDLGEQSPEELLTPLALNASKISLGSLRRLKVIEPINIYPGRYNASDPLRDDYFCPSTWFVLGQEIHASRFLRFVSHEPRLLLKPAYNFLGIPMVQIALDYVANFTVTREAAARLLKKFSLTALKTDMSSILYGGSGDGEVLKRLEHFARYRDNDGVFAVDFTDEDLLQLNTPLSGVDTIVRQALELLAAIWRIPVIKYLGISPSGFNATGESDMRNFYDFVSSQQSKVFGGEMDTLLRVMQLSLFGSIHSGIAYEFLPLWEMTKKERAEINKLNADTDAVLFDRGLLSQGEIRSRLAADPTSGYNGIDPDELPQMPDEQPLHNPDAAGEVW